MSAVELYLLMADNEPGAQVYTAAADRNQAGIVYRGAANMVSASPALKSRLQVVRSQKRIVYEQQNAFLHALSADVPTKEGLNAHAVIFDELHAQRTRDLWDTLVYAGAARRQPLAIAITTAGFDRHSICWEQHEYARKVQDGIIEDWTFLPVIYAAPEEADWTDPEVWKAANPSFGTIINADLFAADCKEAQQSPLKENAFRRYHLNQWTTQDVRWLRMDKWDACGERPIDRMALRGRECYAALDLSTKVDITSLDLWFPDDEVGAWLLPYFWIPAENMRERERRDGVPYPQWHREGWIDATPGNVVDYKAIRGKLLELRDLYDIRAVAYDPWNAQQLATQLQDDDGFEMVEFRQGYASMSGPAKDLEAAILSERVQHGGHPVLRWMADNVAVEQDAAGNIKPSKKHSTERIDGIVTAVMCVGLSAETEGSGTSVYDERGIVSL